MISTYYVVSTGNKDASNAKIIQHSIILPSNTNLPSKKGYSRK